jgi:hypothetical protein
MTGMQRMAAYSSLNPQSTIFPIPRDTTSREYIDALLLNKEEYSTALSELKPATKLLTDQKHAFVGCAFQHAQHQSCFLGSLEAGRAVFRHVIQSYTVINGLTFTYGLSKWIWHRYVKRNAKEKHCKAPLVLFRRFIVATARSCLMLVSYVAVFSYALCALRHITGREFRLS